MIYSLLFTLSIGIAMMPNTPPDLPPCPTTPNCVSSQASDEDHRVDPLPFDGSGEDALERLADVIGAMPRSRIVERQSAFLHATFSSALFGFVDDVHARVDTEKRRIDIRSASRVGYWDLGVNRRRVEDIRKRFAP